MTDTDPAIVTGLLEHNNGPVLITRVDARTPDEVRAEIGGGHYDAEALTTANEAR
jgi:pyridinium-3,5-biscarboxylic acid mononucleotide synthase